MRMMSLAAAGEIVVDSSADPSSVASPVSAASPDALASGALRQRLLEVSHNATSSKAPY